MSELLSSAYRAVRVVLLVAVVFGVACTPAAVVATHPAPPAPTLRAGTSGDYPPLSQWTGDHAEGFAPDLLEAYARQEKIALTWTRFRWPELVSDLRAKRFDVAADGITVRPERSIEGRFTVPIARGGAVLLVRRPSWATTIAPLTIVAIDRPELRVVVNGGGHLERVTRRLLHAATIVAIPSNRAVRDTLIRGEADAAMTNTFEAPQWSAVAPGVEELGPLTRDTTALWVSADRADLAESLDEWLLAEEDSGRLGKLRARTLGPGGGGPTARAVDALLAATAERLALMPLVAAAKQRVGKATEDPAQEERVLAAAADGVAKAAAKHGTTPPPRALVDGFFRAQMEAAKSVQSRSSASPGGAELSLDKDLRPAIARITARMAFLVVRLPAGTHAMSRDAIAVEARDELAESGLDSDHVDRLANALAAFGGR